MYELFRLQIVGRIKKRHAVKYQTPAICSYMQTTKRYNKISEEQSFDIQKVSYRRSEVMGDGGWLVRVNLYLTIMI
jgi:hypothetical protein